MAKKARFEHVCPGCGSTEIQTVDWSGQIGKDGKDEYCGLWMECLACALQGPKPVWDRMAKRRAEIQRALTTSGVEALPPQHQGYMQMIEGFGLKMFRELKANDATKGNFLNWKPKKGEAVPELEHHFVKLTAALGGKKKHQVSESCADMANVVMAIDASLGAK